MIVSGEGNSHILESPEDSLADRRPVVLPGTKEPRATGGKLRFDPTAWIPWFPGLRMPRIVGRFRPCFSGDHERPGCVERQLCTSKVRAGFGPSQNPELSTANPQP